MFRKGYDRTGGFYGRFREGGRSVPEKKFLDGVSVSAFVLTDQWQLFDDGTGVSHFPEIAQGSGAQNRVGRECVVTNINFRGFMLLNSEVTLVDNNNHSNDIVKLAVILDKQCNGAVALASEVWAGTGSQDINSFRNLSFASRFAVLWEKTYVISAPVGGDGTDHYIGGKILPFSFALRVNIPMVYSGTTGAITEIQSNNFFMMAVSADTGAAGLNIRGRMRLRFVG